MSEQPTLITAPAAPAHKPDVSPPPKPGEYTRVVPGVYGVKMRIVGDDGAINIHFKGQALDASEKLKRDHSSYMNVSFSRLSATALTELRKHWVNFDAIQTNGELVIMRPLLTLHFRNKRGDETNALELVKIEPYQQTWPAQFDTIEKFSAWCRDFGMDLYAAKAQFGHDFAAWDVPAVEEWAKAIQTTKEQEREAMDKKLKEMAKKPFKADADETEDDKDEAVKHWASTSARNGFFAWFGEKMKERNFPDVDDARKRWITRLVNEQHEINSEHMHDYPDSVAEFQREAWAIIQRYDTARQHCIKLLDDANIKADVITWQTIFNHDRFWDTVASGLTDMEIIKRVEDFAAHNVGGIKNAAQPAENTAPASGTPEPSATTNGGEKKTISTPNPEPAAKEPKLTQPTNPELVPSPLLTELKTLTGIPVTQIRRYASRKYDPRYMRQIDGKKKDEKWTDLNPIGVRKRLDKLFGFHGLGWRIVPATGGGQVTCTPYTEHVEAKPASNGYPARPAYDRSMYAVTMSGYVLEYALVDATGNIRYVQTSAFSDGDKNDDMGYAHRGAFTSLMKQALKMLGGLDRFIDKAWDGDENEAA